jgi:hypothetical protein
MPTNLEILDENVVDGLLSCDRQVAALSGPGSPELPRQRDGDSSGGDTVTGRVALAAQSRCHHPAPRREILSAMGKKQLVVGRGFGEGGDSAPQPRSARPAQDCKVTLASRQMSSGGPQGGDGAFYLAWDLALEMCKPLEQPCRLSQLHIQPSQGAKSRSGCMGSRLRKYGVGVILPLRHHLYGRCKALEFAILVFWRESVSNLAKNPNRLELFTSWKMVFQCNSIPSCHRCVSRGRKKLCGKGRGGLHTLQHEDGPQ